MNGTKIICNDKDTSFEFDIQYIPIEYASGDHIDISVVIFSNLEIYSGRFELPNDMNSDCFGTTQSVYDMLMDCLSHQNENQLSCHFDIGDNNFNIVIKYESKYMADILKINLKRVEPTTREKSLEKKIKVLTSNVNMLENLIAPMIRELSIIKNNELVYIPEPDDSMTTGKPLRYIHKYLGIDILSGVGRPFSFSEVTDIWIVPYDYINTKAVYDKSLDRYYQETCPTKREQKQNIDITFADWKKTSEVRNAIIEKNNKLIKHSIDCAFQDKINQMNVIAGRNGGYSSFNINEWKKSSDANNILIQIENGIIKNVENHIIVFSTDDKMLYSINDYMFAEYVYHCNQYHNCLVGYNHRPQYKERYVYQTMAHTLKLLIMIMHKFTNLKYLYSTLPFSDISDKKEFIKRIKMISSVEEYIFPGKES